jgi:asparagine synthetase B (glutamine-hydrolysing)
MCGIYCSNLAPLAEEGVGERLLKARGPDALTRVNIDSFHVSHSLLSITGESCDQPFLKNNIAWLYNGEIYNYEDYGDYDTDGKCIEGAYYRDGVLFPQNLDGEFALVLFDRPRNLIVISTDTFGTKPLYYSLEGREFGCSSYKAPLEEAGHKNIQKLPPNTIRVINMLHYQNVSYTDHKVTSFNLEQKNKTSEGWITAFEDAIRKRTKNCREKIFLGVSSGHDSGAIYNELINQSVPFKAYSVRGEEMEDLIDQRKKIIESTPNCFHENIPKSHELYQIHNKFITENTETFQYAIKSDVGDYDSFIPLTRDDGSNWLSTVCAHAKEDGYKVNLSGGGADEIISDYGHNGERYFPQSNFGGLFPENLEDIFPWGSVFGSCQEAYLMKEEYVGGAYGIETRYPFLDKKVVQEFLNLDHTLKNRNYKSVLHTYLDRNNVPFAPNEKRGF